MRHLRDLLENNFRGTFYDLLEQQNNWLVFFYKVLFFFKVLKREFDPKNNKSIEAVSVECNLAF